MSVEALLPATSTPAPDTITSNVYTRAEFECGIAVSYPAHWDVLPAETDLNIQAHAQARGGPTRPPGSKTLILLNSKPEPHGAQLRVILEPPNSDLTQQSLLYLANDTSALRATSDQLLQVFRAQEATGGVRVRHMRMAQVVQVAGFAAAYISYDRDDPLDSSGWRVDQYQIPIDGATIHFTISYRADQEQHWSPILHASLASLETESRCALQVAVGVK